jgi:hypothetical protein
MNRRTLAFIALLAAAPLAAEAQSFRCVGKDGKRYYGSTAPAECYGRPMEQLNAQGMVVKRIDPAASERERLAKEAADAKKREHDDANRDAARRNHALLSTYTSEKDIDEARARALADNSKAAREVEARIEAIRKLQSGYDNELASYKGRGEPPAKLRDDIKNADDDLKAHQHLLEVKRREVDSINARYDEDKKRYVQLTRQR